MRFRALALLGLLAFVVSAPAEFLLHPNENTIWQEDGRQISGWDGGLKLRERPRGGFSLTHDGDPHDGGRYVETPEDGLWLVFELESFETLPGYVGLDIKGGLVNMVSNPMPGLFAVRLPAHDKVTFLRIDSHGLVSNFKYLKLVRVPEYYLEASLEEDGSLAVTAHLEKPAEDVSVSFYDAYGMKRVRLGGADTLQLYPTDEANPVEWTGRLPVAGYEGTGKLMLKAMVLGGSLKTPVWTALPKDLWK